MGRDTREHYTVPDIKEGNISEEALELAYGKEEATAA